MAFGSLRLFSDLVDDRLLVSANRELSLSEYVGTLLVHRVHALVFAHIVCLDAIVFHGTRLLDNVVLLTANKNPEILRNAAFELSSLVITIVLLPILGGIGILIPEIAAYLAYEFDFALAVLEEKIDPVKPEAISTDGVGLYLHVTHGIRKSSFHLCNLIASPLSETIIASDEASQLLNAFKIS